MLEYNSEKHMMKLLKRSTRSFMVKEKSDLRKKQDEAIRDFIKEEVVCDEDSHRAYENRVDNWTKRFEAVRSIQGLDYGNDPVANPKLEPWKYSSDVGIPLEAIIIRAIIARFIKTIFTKPMCNITGRGFSDKKAAKIIEEYNEYTLEEEIKFERQYYDIL